MGRPSPDRMPPDPDWTGPRPLVSGTPVVIGAIVIAIALVAMFASVARRPGLPAHLSQEYTRVMAGSLAPDIAIEDPARLAESLRRAGLPFDVRIPALDPPMRLLGGRVSEVVGRPTAAWIYRSPAADSVLGEAFQGRLADLGTPDERRTDVPPALTLFRKMTQTLVCWEEGPLVYVLVSTLPTEQVIALARRAHPSDAPDTAPR
jgi:hypothetical protein